MSNETNAVSVSLVYPEMLSGQYYILVSYKGESKRIYQTTVTPDRAVLLKRSTYGAVKGAPEPVGQIVELLDGYRKLSGYAIVGDEAASELSVLSKAKLEFAMKREEGKTVDLVKSGKKHSLYVSRSLDIKNVSRAIDKYWHTKENGYAVNNAIFVGMVSMFDELIAKLIRESLKSVPELMNSFAMSIPYSEIVASDNFDALKDGLVESTVQSLMWKGRAEQIKWIEKNITKNEFSSIIPNYKDFIELTERRNVYVHNDGIATREYARKLKDVGIVVSEEIVGKRLNLFSKYFLDSADNLIEAYIVISQSVVRKLTKSAGSEVKDVIDSRFNQASYYQISNERFSSASRIAGVIVSDKFAVSDITMKMATVNRAIALKKMGEAAEVEKVLSSCDWSSAKDEFQICIAAVREDLDAVEKLVPKLKGSEWITPSSYFEWPAFEWVRQKKKFWNLLENTYGDEIRGVVDTVVETASVESSKQLEFSES